MFKLDLEKAEEPEIKFSTSMGQRKSKKIPKTSTVCFINYAKTFDCVDHSKLQKFLKELGISYHLTWLLRNLFADQESTVRTRHEKNKLVPNRERSM